jgi:magnesium transporter
MPFSQNKFNGVIIPFKRLKHIDKIGLPPGTIVHIGEKKTDQTTIDRMIYSPTDLSQDKFESWDDEIAIPAGADYAWLNIAGLHDTTLLTKIGERFNIHPLILEDISNTEQRPKIEYLDEQIFVILKHVAFDQATATVATEHICLLLGGNYVLSFQEYKIGIFEPLRKRLQTAAGRFYGHGPDYLFFAIMDIVVDNYDLALEQIEDTMEKLEEGVLNVPEKSQLALIHNLKKEVSIAKKTIGPVRELVRSIDFLKSELLQDKNSAYFRDLHDHIVQISENIESARENTSALLDTYLTNVSNRMNEVMKVLTLVATIFIPLSFLAGVYGMNFEFMPELKWSMGYFVFWGLAITLGLGMFFYFRARRWL